MKCFFIGLLIVLSLTPRGLAAEVAFGASYDGTYQPDAVVVPENQSVWSRGGSRLPILPNSEAGKASHGVAAFNDNSRTDRIQMSIRHYQAFGVDPETQEYQFALEAKFFSEGAAMDSAGAPTAVAIVGCRDEDALHSYGRAVLLGFFIDIDVTQPGQQSGIGLVDENGRLIREVLRGRFHDDVAHRYEVRKYRAGDQLRLRVTMDGKTLLEDFDYRSLPNATRSQDGFGYFTSTPGTINASISELSFGVPSAGQRRATQVDLRAIENGNVIADKGYADQPYIIRNADNSLTCLVTVADGREGARSQRIISLRSLDEGYTWSAPAAVEPAGSPENSWAVPVQAQSGRIYVIYTVNGTNLRAVKMEDGQMLTRVDMLGNLVFRYSDDMGQSWSKERYDISIRATEFDLTNVYKGDVNGDGKVDDADPKFFWTPSKAYSEGGTTYLGISKIQNFRVSTLIAATEGYVFRSDNLLSEPDPGKIQWALVPQGRIGLRSRKGEVSEEATPMVLSDGTLVVICRTVDGEILGFYSTNRGESFSAPEPLKYALDGRSLKNPRAKPALWKIGEGKYLLWFENNGNKGYEFRNPAWVALGTERNGRLVFSQPEILLYSRETALGISYPDFLRSRSGYVVTETQKAIARIHPVSDQLIEGLLGQGQDRHLVGEGLVANWRAGGPKTLTLPAVPTVATPAGFTFEFWVKFSGLRGEQIVLASDNPGPDGMSFSVNDSGQMALSIKQGQAEIKALSDEGGIKPNTWNHVVCIVESGPRIVMWVVNGKFSDGGDKRVFGWTRFPVTLGALADTPTMRVSTKLKGTIQHIRYYDRALRVSEAISNHRHGPPK